MLKQKKILLGITGGIAAYKCAHLVRLFIKEGAEVKVILTKAAAEFITAQTLSVLSKNEVLIDFFDADFNWNNHVHLAEWADVFLIAPLTANTLAKMANGQCDNLLLATYFSSKSNTIVAPAMDLDMYKHDTVKSNLDKLKLYGNLIIPAETGDLASGLNGEGRMAEPETIISFVETYFFKSLPLFGKKVLVNAGPTYEAIDPVRFIGNRSSGKMGVAIAEQLAAYGALVTLVLGPSNLIIKNKLIQVISVESSDEMYKAMISNFKNKYLVICSSAVADYKPVSVYKQKIKKKENHFKLELTKTKDILTELGNLKTKQCLVGFALESENLVKHATQKLIEKKLDVIIANSAVEEGGAFGLDTNKIIIINKHNKITKFELKTKKEVALDVVNYLIDFLK
jgi:phosphopantothenoylcysteine decarboxylase/phosphopantothenate--cysteine ligase